MWSAMIMEAILTKIKAVLSEAEEVLAIAVTPEASEAVNRLLGEAMSAGWTEGVQLGWRRPKRTRRQSKWRGKPTATNWTVRRNSSRRAG